MIATNISPLKKIVFVLLSLILITIGVLLFENKTKNSSDSMNTNSLIGTNWKLTEYPNASGEMTQVTMKAAPTMSFTNGTSVSGNGGCNSYSGKYEVDGKKITFGELQSTLMYCEEGSEIESEFMKALSDTKNYKVEANQMLILDEDNNTILKFEPNEN